MAHKVISTVCISHTEEVFRVLTFTFWHFAFTNCQQQPAMVLGGWPTFACCDWCSVWVSWCLNISSWWSPILGTMSLPTTTLVMNDWLASIASLLQYNNSEVVVKVAILMMMILVVWKKNQHTCNYFLGHLVSGAENAWTTAPNSAHSCACIDCFFRRF